MDKKRKVHKYTQKWTDAQKMHKKHPKKFYAPDLRDLEYLRAGDLIQFSTGKERPWMIVFDFDGNTIRGILDNVTIDKSMKRGDIIEIQRRHVMNVEQGNSTSNKIAREYLRESLKKAKVPKSATLRGAKGRGSSRIAVYMRKGKPKDRLIVVGGLDMTPYAKDLNARSKKARTSSLIRFSGSLTPKQEENAIDLATQR